MSASTDSIKNQINTSIAGQLRATVGATALILNLCAHGLLLFILIALMWPIPNWHWRHFWQRRIEGLIRHWSVYNQKILQRGLAATWQVNMPANLNPKHNYLMIANHQSWFDAMVLFWLADGIPFPRFIGKRSVLLYPIVGQAAWAVGYPMVHRYGKVHLEQHPEHNEIDKAIINRAIRKTGNRAVTFGSFCEGTRRTQKKLDTLVEPSPYKHLLHYKPAGVGYILKHIGPRLDAVLDVTFVFKGPQLLTLWQMLAGHLDKVVIEGRLLPLPAELKHGDYRQDPIYHDNLHAWMANIWQEKDARMQVIYDAD